MFHERGLPQAIRSDNGVPFASPHGLFQLSKFSVWWLRLGISIERIRPVKAGVLKEGEKIRFGFYKLRHSWASFSVRKGTDVKTVQRMLRHSDVSTTLGIYAHSMSEDRLAA
ncbi:MAG TPA: tyrosine-type recombinase/integrase [Candidatus Sulfotelmatobacter sp.]|nr:tyrosine-type recombinase/integrase [Candidatus Sulfotelmatobacter sp.]